MSDDDKPERSWWERRPFWLRILIIVGAMVAFVLIWLLIPPLLYRSVVDDAARLKAITDTRTALLAGLVGIGALGTFWLNARTQRFTAQTLRISEANFQLAERSQRESFQLTQLGHLTDRYAKAIEQLGNDNLDVRLGGIYALEQVATDSPRDRDQATIVEVLSAFVRVHSDPFYQGGASIPAVGSEPAEPEGAEPAELRLEGGLIDDTGVDRGPPLDVQAAGTVLGRLPNRLQVQRADLTGASLMHANLFAANLSGAILVRTNLSGANLRRANLSRAEVFEANLSFAVLAAANLSGAKLVRADLSRADLHKADLSGVNLTVANLSHALLSLADLSEADLTGADLTTADLSGARLTGANLTKARCLTEEQLDVALGDSQTMLPTGLRRPDAWTR